MSFKDVLVHLDQTEASVARGALALDLARRFDAHVTGLFSAAEPQWPSDLHTHMVSQVIEATREEVAEHGRIALARFSDQAKAEGLSVESRFESCLENDLTTLLTTQARCSDLLILGQPEPESTTGLTQPVVESVILAAGSPVLMVPYTGVARAPGSRVLIGWDASREAARAVHDALPLLTQADSIVVLTLDAKTGPGRHGEEPGADIARTLARHGCTVEVRQDRTGSLSVGDAILSRLADLSADLLVMGAYGHSRLRELVLGGATRHILGHMTVPVLMSH